jgi:hypothetical protein
VGPLGGTRYGTYVANWTVRYEYASTGHTDVAKGDVPGLGLIDDDVGLLRRLDCDIPTQGLI